MPDNFWFGLILTALLLLVGHWLPWPKKLPRLLAYAYGVGCILLGLAVWLLPADWRTWLGIGAFCAAGGLATLAAYAYDTWRNHEILKSHDNGKGSEAL